MLRHKTEFLGYLFGLFFLLVIFLCAKAFGATILVPGHWPNIQEQINAEIHGDSVLVADGTYSGGGNKNLDFKGKAVAVQSQNGPVACIIDCQNDGRGFFFHHGEGQDTLVSGFTITNGNVTDGNTSQWLVLAQPR